MACQHDGFSLGGGCHIGKVGDKAFAPAEVGVMVVHDGIKARGSRVVFILGVSLFALTLIELYLLDNRLGEEIHQSVHAAQLVAVPLTIILAHIALELVARHGFDDVLLESGQMALRVFVVLYIYK